jgi:3-carboxy-cis,cis-muconate cycloisomerase
MLGRLTEVLRGLVLDPERMRRNLDLGGGLIMAEAVMLELGRTLGRQHAHDIVYDGAQAAFVEGRAFSEVLASDARVTAHLNPDGIRKLLDPVAYTGLCAEGAKSARTLAARLRDVR